MRYLIVNADDFGVSQGVNRGILEAHRYGIVTSASLMVNTAFSAEAARMAQTNRQLSVGLHADLGGELAGGAAGLTQRLRAALRKQFACFQKLLGRLPTHIDSHHNVHRDPRALPHFVELAAEHGLPLREHSPARYYPKFYGQWSGETHLEQIGVENFEHILESETAEGITELSCHPGYAGNGLATGYAAEREVELRTLCDPAVRRMLAVHAIQLVSYHDLGELTVNTTT
jgi:predicted glycoside hydrolase/deacetylase ChbG (UPF0249 family)